MNQELATQADIPSHKLTLKREDGTFKQFYLTEKQAFVISKTINAPDQFIVLPKDIDRDSPSFYPKRGAWLERISKDEQEARMKKYDRAVDAVAEAKQEEAKKFESGKVDKWIEENPEAWEQKKQDAFVKMKSGTLFNGASDVVQSVLVRMEARRMVHADITKTASS